MAQSDAAKAAKFHTSHLNQSCLKNSSKSTSNVMMVSDFFYKDEESKYCINRYNAAIFLHYIMYEDSFYVACLNLISRKLQTRVLLYYDCGKTLQLMAEGNERICPNLTEL